MASNDQQRRLEIEELASQLGTMRDSNAGILHQEQQAIISTRALEEAAQATHRDAEFKHQSDQEQMRQLATRAEQMVESADRKTTIAALESDSDREMVVLARRGEAQAHEQTHQIEQEHAHATRWSSALHGGGASGVCYQDQTTTRRTLPATRRADEAIPAISSGK